MGQNIEIKARCNNLDKIRNQMAELPAEHSGTEKQHDTFFVTPKGRLKLRQSSLYGDSLIPYMRENQEGPKQSNYALIKLSNGEKTKKLLSEILGTRIEVLKKREVYIYENVRIHLDLVENLGEFIELEAVIDSEDEMEANYNKVQHLMELLEIEQKDLMDVAYADLLEHVNNSSESHKDD
jgi:predicted adenylyl cyclase CyaB